MAFRFVVCQPAAVVSHFRPLNHSNFLLLSLQGTVEIRQATGTRTLRIRALDGGESHLGMWTPVEFQKKAVENDDRNGRGRIAEHLEEEKSDPIEEIDRAAAAFAAARAFVDETEEAEANLCDLDGYVTYDCLESDEREQEILSKLESEKDLPETKTSQTGAPGPDFWKWKPPLDNTTSSQLQQLEESQTYPQLSNFVEEKQPPCSIPFQTNISASVKPLLPPPFQSSIDVGLESIRKTYSLEEYKNFGIEFSIYAVEASHALRSVDKESMEGVDSDGSRWWRETGVEESSAGVICRWTLTRGVSADLATEWQNTYWEAADEFEYKELGSEKSGRDSDGNVWIDYWKESIRQEDGIVHIEKTANKWGKNGRATKWLEAWSEYYNGNGEVEKNAYKWCRINPYSYVDPGHAHNWHERWGEKYDGIGGSIKYTDKWAERRERDGWTKWGDKWDENFDPSGHGTKQGETWWEGKRGERWNRTWGEGHNGSGWVHKYGKSSTGEHWDTHVEQETWYEKYPHFGFYHCFNNSTQLREVQRPSEKSL